MCVCFIVTLSFHNIIGYKASCSCCKYIIILYIINSNIHFVIQLNDFVSVYLRSNGVQKSPLASHKYAKYVSNTNRARARSNTTKYMHLLLFFQS